MDQILSRTTLEPLDSNFILRYVVVSSKSYSSIPESRLFRQAKKIVPSFPYATFMSPFFDACSLAIIERPGNIGWTSNLYSWKEQELLYPTACKRGSKLSWKVFVALRKSRMFVVR